MAPAPWGPGRPPPRSARAGSRARRCPRLVSLRRVPALHPPQARSCRAKSGAARRLAPAPALYEETCPITMPQHRDPAKAQRPPMHRSGAFPGCGLPGRSLQRGAFPGRGIICVRRHEAPRAPCEMWRYSRQFSALGKGKGQLRGVLNGASARAGRASNIGHPAAPSPCESGLISPPTRAHNAAHTAARPWGAVKVAQHNDAGGGAPLLGCSS